MKRILSFFLGLFLLTSMLHAQDITGKWSGNLSVQGMTLPIVFNISEDGDGYNSTMDSPAQGAFGIEVSTTEFKEKVLKLQVPKAGIDYSGTMNDKGEISGDFKQSGMVLPLTLTRGESAEEKAATQEKPQNPKPPLPYEEEEVEFENTADGVKLVGTLTLPKKGKNLPAVVLISGSGPQDRDEFLLGHKPFLVLADHLTREGFAVLRFDDRGVGKSTGKFSGATSEDFARDVQAGMAYLQTRKEIDGDKIGLAGHSEGGLIAPMIAAEKESVAFVVMIAGPSIPATQLLLRQQSLIMEANGATETEVKNAEQLQQGLFEIATRVEDTEEASEMMEVYLKANMKLLPEDERPKDEEEKAFIDLQIRQLNSPWFRFFLKYDPAEALAKTNCPTLALYAEKDLQVPAPENVAALNQLIEESQKTNIEPLELPGLNHLMQTAETGSPKEYGTIEETFSPKALEAISNWMKGAVK